MDYAYLVLVYGTYLHKCESKSKQDIKYEPNKPQKPYESPNDKAMVKEGFGLVGVASVLALLALVAFIFNRA